MMKPADKPNNRRLWILAPTYAWLFVFLMLPFLVVLAISLSEITEANPPYLLFIRHAQDGWHFLPYLDNFKLIFSDALYIKAYWDSIKLAGISTFITLLIGYPIAYGIKESSPNWRIILLLLVIIPFWTSLLIRVYAWIVILKNTGLLNQLLMALHIINQPLTIINTQGAVILGIVYSYLPFMVLPIYLSLEKINPTLLEAAQDLGCKPYASFWRVTFPLSLPGVVAGCLLVFIPAVGEFVIPDLLGGSQVMTIGKVLWNEFFLNRDWPTAAAVTVAMSTILIVPIMILQHYLGKRSS